MNRIAKKLLVAFFCFAVAPPAFAAAVSLRPQSVLQGDTVMVRMEGVAGTADVSQVLFLSKKQPVFLYDGVPTALAGIDLNQKPGTYDVRVVLKNGRALVQTVTVREREKPAEELGIPQKLGGNTRQAQTALVSYLSSENAIIARLRTGYKSFWTQPFAYPLKDASVTDEYGYERQTGAYVISHKGTDFHAPAGTPVLAMNRGVVRFARSFKIYGKTVIVDHGLGVMTMYMHLSKIKVNVGQLVLPGQVLALSGDTGYAEAAHLHVSVRIAGISVDPVQFLGLFGK